MKFEGIPKPSGKQETPPEQQAEQTLHGLKVQMEERGLVENMEVVTSPEGIREALSQILPENKQD